MKGLMKSTIAAAMLTIVVGGPALAHPVGPGGPNMMGWGGWGPGMMSGWGPGGGGGWGSGPGMMGGWGPGPGMMGGWGPGPGMMGGWGPGQGMMGGWGPGQGMMGGWGPGPGMMGGWGPGQGMMGPPGEREATGPLTPDDVRQFVERHLAWMGNPRLKVGNVTEKDGTITAEIVTQDGSLVDRFAVDPQTGAMRRVD